MRKQITVVVVIVLIVVAGGAFYLAAHKSKTNNTTNSSNNTSSSYGSSSSNSTSNTTSNNPAVNNAIVQTKTSSAIGSYLADPNNNALYTFGADTNGVSNCTGSCLAAWPAYQDKGATTGLPANFGTIKRTDNGETQYTYKGMPLYLFESDSPGQVTGNGVSNFSVARP